MAKFEGFPPGKVKMTAIPAQFFRDLLPQIDDLAEMKVILFSFWALYQKEGDFRYLSHKDYLRDENLMDGLSQIDTAVPAEETLGIALEKAVKRGALLKACVELNATTEALYFMNTARGRTAVEQIEAGNWQPGPDTEPVEILPERPNIYALYEANIGPLKPLIVDELKDAEKEFPAEWLEEAIRISVESNARNWRYIRAILDRWQQEGRTHEPDGRDSLTNGKHYVTGKYADWIDS